MKTIQIILLLILIPFFNVYAQGTYTVGKTEYYHNKFYPSTGKPVVKRSEANKREFLKSLGYDKIPYGYEIDHKKPLCDGGTDDPENMQLITIEDHKKKTAKESTERSNSTYSTSSNNYYSNSVSNNYYNSLNSSPSTNNEVDSKGNTIYEGARGGKYYINSSGAKIYIKSEEIKSNSYFYSNPTYSSPTRSSNSSSSTGNTIHTGPRGGKYYINSNGNKTYIKK